MTHPAYVKSLPNHSISSQNLSLEQFWELEFGSVLISPLGNLFSYGDPKVSVEIVPTEIPDDDDTDVIQMVEFQDAAGNDRVITFVNGMAVGYDLLVIDNEIPIDTTILDFEETDPEWNAFILADRGVTEEDYLNL
jgi:hypothetical protein